MTRGTRTIEVTVNRQGLVILDAARRAYMAESRDHLYQHLIRPATPTDWVVREGMRRVGDLTCTCDGGRQYGTCYRVAQAEAYEASVIAWGAAPEPLAVAL